MDEAGSINDAALVDAWRLPPSVLAYLDWTTGLLRVNVESADFEPLAAGHYQKARCSMKRFATNSSTPARFARRAFSITMCFRSHGQFGWRRSNWTATNC